ncbi:CHL4-domain-containing protein [Sodiomyces alkalinus F11]|uniref:CHL4-domain-containing protein n=1 Tax=Sodiomyces alkalinus (strain CBS 110278 / VKM F-3762 / F11) TaxID=1314773 RepID=A0A3N2QA24_SODAK|nr:CHL4-domain-containing protein [Sodiomyces alkalinus F11]ROT43495.1 CHL4-domain-containing protein [Sodiomyces alkalinus F11]
MSRLSVPTSGRLSPTVRISNSTVVVQKVINRLSRQALLSLALDWMDEPNRALCAPLLQDYDDPNDFYPPVSSLAKLRELYRDMETRKGSKKEVSDRILEGDWRHGLSLYQLAMADVRYLHEHPTWQKWMVYRILPLAINPDLDTEADASEVDHESLSVSRLHPSSFLKNLQSQVLPDTKAHYHLHRLPELRLLLIRVFLIDTPYSNNLPSGNGSSSADATHADTSRTLYIVFPDGAPFVYISKIQGASASSGGADSKLFRNLVTDSIPKALSRPRERYTLKYTNIQGKNLQALLSMKGAGRGNAADGGWSMYADKRKESPLDTLLPTPPLSEDSSDDVILENLKRGTKRKSHIDVAEEQCIRKARRSAQARFGNSARPEDGRGVERVDISMRDPFKTRRAGERQIAEHDTEGLSSWAPEVKLTFRGPHVFAGMRLLVENGIINGQRMPGWLTGEEGVTVGEVRHGRVQGHYGSGF